MKFTRRNLEALAGLVCGNWAGRRLRERII